MPKKDQNPLFNRLREVRHSYNALEVVQCCSQVSEQRVNALAANLATYMRTNLPEAIERRSGLSQYRTNPYVLMKGFSRGEIFTTAPPRRQI